MRQILRIWVDRKADGVIELKQRLLTRTQKNQTVMNATCFLELNMATLLTGVANASERNLSASQARSRFIRLPQVLRSSHVKYFRVRLKGLLPWVH